MQRIDIEEASKFHQVLALCRSKGANAVQVLDEARMLRHMGTRREDAVRTLEGAIHKIVTTPPGHEIKTVMDMRNMAIELLRELQNDIAKEH